MSFIEMLCVMTVFKTRTGDYAQLLSRQHVVYITVKPEKRITQFRSNFTPIIFLSGFYLHLFMQNHNTITLCWLNKT